jgi:transposase-like protein
MSAGLTDDNIVEQDHRAIKYIVRPILGFKSMRCAQSLLAGIETLHMIRKGQWTAPKGKSCGQRSNSSIWPFEAQQPAQLRST